MRWLAPAGAAGALSTFIFHRVLERDDPLRVGEPDAARFERIVAFITRHFQVLQLADAAARLTAGRLPAAAACITFDDGYADNLTIAAPILKRHGATATVFIATAYSDGGRMWNDSVIEALRACRAPSIDLEAAGLGRWSLDGVQARRDAIGRLLPTIKYLDPTARAASVAAVQAACGEPLPDDLMMRSEQVIALRRAGMQIGAHTRSHPILTRLAPDAAADEIAGSKRDLEALLGEPVSLFAYPNGRPGTDYAAVHVDMVRGAGFAGAVSTAPGAANAGGDPFQLPRFLPWDREPLRFGLRMLANLRGSVAQA